MQFQHIPTNWPEPTIVYPRLRRLKAHHDVVLLCDTPNSGMCLASDSPGMYKVGEYYTGRLNSSFEDYRNIIQLKNDA